MVHQHNTYNPTASRSLINTAICALFAASATKLKSRKKGDAVFASLTPLCPCPCCWPGACTWFTEPAGCGVYEDCCKVDVDCDSEGEETGASIVGRGTWDAGRGTSEAEVDKDNVSGEGEDDR